MVKTLHFGQHGSDEIKHIKLDNSVVLNYKDIVTIKLGDTYYHIEIIGVNKALDDNMKVSSVDYSGYVISLAVDGEDLERELKDLIDDIDKSY